MKTSILTLLVFSIIFLASCSTQNLFVDKKADNRPEALPEVFRTDYSYQYHIRKDDKISISVWEQDDLGVGSSYGIYNSNEVYGKWLMVDAEGMISIPKIGQFKVENKTIIQLKDTLRVRFGEWVLNPIVDIKVLNREISILGEVRNPQVIPVDKERNTLLQIVSAAGGFEFYAELSNIKVLRQSGEDVHVANINLTKNGDFLNKNIHLYPGDVVIVPSKWNKEFDKRVGTIIPFTTTITAAGIFMGLF
jgi:polysaccharide export outer membrane protein